MQMTDIIIQLLIFKTNIVDDIIWLQFRCHFNHDHIYSICALLRRKPASPPVLQDSVKEIHLRIWKYENINNIKLVCENERYIYSLSCLIYLSFQVTKFRDRGFTPAKFLSRLFSFEKCFIWNQDPVGQTVY